MYNYETEKPNVFTEEGQEMFLAVRDKTKVLLEQSGCFTMGKAISGVSGDSWTMLACVDRLVELGEIEEIKQDRVQGQNRIFIKKG